MTYQLEDEVDWSDGTLDDSPSTAAGPSGDSGYVSSTILDDVNPDYLFEIQEEDEYGVPLGVALPPSSSGFSVPKHC